jgi:hypothetical protein
MAKTILDVLREICAAGCTARVTLSRRNPDAPCYYVMAVSQHGSPLTGILVNVDGGVHEGEFHYLVEDIADPKTWATVEEQPPERVQ